MLGSGSGLFHLPHTHYKLKKRLVVNNQNSVMRKPKRKPRGFL